MGDYSERQLLILSNLVYLPLDDNVSNMSVREVLDNYRDADGGFTPDSVYYAGTGGGLTRDDICRLFEEMDEEVKRNPWFGELSPSRRLDDCNVKAVCYTDSKDNNPVVVFRGTGGSVEAWTDNIEGGYETDTKLQALAADFVKNECGSYKDIIVTGHSKGGNMSQYVTVVCSDMVSRCVSFDGQGFCDDFINNNKEKIESASPKIKSIAAHNDFVNILLTPIAGTTVYTENYGRGVNAHSSLWMLTSNQYDKAGEITSLKGQSYVARKLKQLSDKLVEKINPLDNISKTMISYITGKAIATGMEAGEYENGTAKTLYGVAGSVTAVFASKMAEHGAFPTYDKSIHTEYVFAEDSSINKCIYALGELSDDICSIRNEVVRINEQNAYNMASKIYIENKMTRICEKLYKISDNINVMSTTLGMIKQRYSDKEKSLVELICMK